MAAPLRINSKSERDRVRRLQWVSMCRRRILRDNINPFNKSEENFRALYRFDRSTVTLLVNDCSKYFDSGPLPPLIRVCAALYYFFNGSFQQEFSNILQGQEFENIWLVASSFRSLSSNWINFPQINEYDEIKKVFAEKTTFPGVIGVLDNMHVRIDKPRDDKVAVNYLNSGRFYSINVQLICDYNAKILEVVTAFGGATKDYVVWDRSMISSIMEHRYIVEKVKDTWLLGSSCYRLSPWLLIPYSPPTNLQERKFNEIHENVRGCASRLKSLLWANFRCLNGIALASPDNARNIIRACTILHNMMLKRELVEETQETSRYPAELHGVCIQDEFSSNYELGRWKRDRAKDLFFQSREIKLVIKLTLQKCRRHK